MPLYGLLIALLVDGTGMKMSLPYNQCVALERQMTSDPYVKIVVCEPQFNYMQVKL